MAARKQRGEGAAGACTLPDAASDPLFQPHPTYHPVSPSDREGLIRLRLSHAKHLTSKHSCINPGALGGVLPIQATSTLHSQTVDRLSSTE